MAQLGEHLVEQSDFYLLLHSQILCYFHLSDHLHHTGHFLRAWLVYTDVMATSEKQRCRFHGVCLRWLVALRF